MRNQKINLLTISVSMLAGFAAVNAQHPVVYAAEDTISNDKTVASDYTAPTQGDSAYLKGLALDAQHFDRVEDAVKYAVDRSDDATHYNYAIRNHNGRYIVYWIPKADEPSVAETQPTDQAQAPKASATDQTTHKAPVKETAKSEETKLETNNQVTPAKDKKESTPVAPSSDEARPSTSYTVKAGDSFWKIARAQGVSLDALKKANPNYVAMIHPGDKLVIPSPAKANASTAKSSTSHASTDFDTSGKLLDDKVFTSVDQALSYGRSHFDWKKDKQFYVRFDNGQYRLWWEPLQAEANTPKSPTKKEDKKAEAKPSPAKSSSYQVVAGDSLWKIATKNGTSVEALKSANKLTSNMIHPGDRLVIPGQAVASKPASQPTKKTVQSKTDLPTSYVRDERLFKDIASALAYGRQVFNNKTDNQFYVNWDQTRGGYAVDWDKKASVKAQPKPAAKAQSTYTVKAGDSIWKIATSHGITMDALRKANGLSGNLIHPGDQLTLPA